MKQRIRVIGLIRGNGGILVLKRNRGRSDEPVFWELPTGKIMFGDQPEEAMSKVVEDCLGAEIGSIQVKDAITFVALEGSSQLNNLCIVYDITLKTNINMQPNDRYTAYKYLRDGNSDGIRLNETSSTVLEIEGEKHGGAQLARSARLSANSATVYVDGASRGNPGPAGIGYCIMNEDGKIVERGGEFVGFASSRMAEYYAFRNGINKALALNISSVRLVSDSLMLVNQINGIYQVKNRDVMPVYNEIKSLLKKFKAVAVVHTKRLNNSAADKEANLAIDRILKK